MRTVDAREPVAVQHVGTGDADRALAGDGAFHHPSVHARHVRASGPADRDQRAWPAGGQRVLVVARPGRRPPPNRRPERQPIGTTRHRAFPQRRGALGVVDVVQEPGGQGDRRMPCGTSGQRIAESRGRVRTELIDACFAQATVVEHDESIIKGADARGVSGHGDLVYGSARRHGEDPDPLVLHKSGTFGVHREVKPRIHCGDRQADLVPDDGTPTAGAPRDDDGPFVSAHPGQPAGAQCDAPNPIPARLECRHRARRQVEVPNPARRLQQDPGLVGLRAVDAGHTQPRHPPVHVRQAQRRIATEVRREPTVSRGVQDVLVAQELSAPPDHARREIEPGEPLVVVTPGHTAHDVERLPVPQIVHRDAGNRGQLVRRRQSREDGAGRLSTDDEHGLFACRHVVGVRVPACVVRDDDGAVDVRASTGGRCSQQGAEHGQCTK